MASDLKLSKSEDKAPSKDAKSKPASSDSAAKAKPSAEPSRPQSPKAGDQIEKAQADIDAATKDADNAADAEGADKPQDELRPGALTAASAGAPGLLPGQQINPSRAPHNAPLTSSKDGDVVVSTVNESGATDGPLKREVHLQREPLTGVNPVTGQPHAGQAPRLRDASMGAFEGDQPNRSSDQLSDPSKLDQLGGQSGFDNTKDVVGKVKDWLGDANDSLGDLKTKGQAFVDAFEGLFQGSQSSAPSQSTPPSQPAQPQQPAPTDPSQSGSANSGSTSDSSSK